MVDKDDIVIFLLALSIGVWFLFVTDNILTDSTETPEYQAGYQAGYTEKNESKYQAACNLSDTFFMKCTTEQFHYAKGYKYGYRQYQIDLIWNNEQNKTNNSLEILGI